MSIPAIDKFFSLLDSDKSQQVIGDVYFFDDLPDLERLQSKALEISQFLYGLENVESFISKKFGKDYYQNLSLELNNLSRIEVAELSEQSFLKEIEEAFSKPLSYSSASDVSKSFELPWSYVFFKNSSGKQLNGSHVLLFKTHHRICDGVSLIQLSKMLEDDCPEFSRDSFLDLLNQSDNQSSFFSSPFKKFLKLANHSFFYRLAHLNKLLFSTSPFNFLKGKSSSDRKLCFFEIPSEPILALKKKANASPNNILMSVIADALKDCSKLKGVDVENVTAIVPVNIRGEKIKNFIGNYISVRLIELPLNIGSPLKLLKKVSENSEKVVKTAGTESVYLGFRILSKLPSIFRRKVLGLALRKVSFISTNIPANKTLFKVADKKITGRFIIPALIESQGLGFSFVSYYNKYFITIVSDPAIVTDAQMIKEKIEESFLKFSEVSTLSSSLVQDSS